MEYVGAAGGSVDLLMKRDFAPAKERLAERDGSSGGRAGADRGDEGERDESAEGVH